MKVYVSVDMEGIAGISHPEPDGARRHRLPGGGRADGRRGERRDRRAPSPAARPRCSSTTATAAMYNLRPGRRSIRGRSAAPGPEALVDGRRRRAGSRLRTWPCSSATTPGPATRPGRSPTPTPARPVATRLNGRPVGETGINAVVLGAWGVPVGLVAGDDVLADEIADWLPWAERVVVKEGVRAATPRPRSIRAAPRDLIRAGAERAVRRAIAGELELLDRRAADDRSRSTTGTRSRPTTRRSCPGAERVGGPGVASSPPIRSRPIAGSSPGSGWPAW